MTSRRPAVWSLFDPPGVERQDALGSVYEGWRPVVAMIYDHLARTGEPNPRDVTVWCSVLTVVPALPVSWRVARAVAAAQRLAARTCLMCGRRAAHLVDVAGDQYPVPLCPAHSGQVAAYEGRLSWAMDSRAHVRAHAPEPARTVLLGESVSPEAYRATLAILASLRACDRADDKWWCYPADIVWVLDDATREQRAALTPADVEAFLHDEEETIRSAAIRLLGRIGDFAATHAEDAPESPAPIAPNKP